MSRDESERCVSRNFEGVRRLFEYRKMDVPQIAPIQTHIRVHGRERFSRTPYFIRACQRPRDKGIEYSVKFSVFIPCPLSVHPKNCGENIRIDRTRICSCQLLTDGVRTHRTCIDTEQGDSDECPIAAEAKNGVPELECGLMFFIVILVEVDICSKRDRQ